MSMDEEISENYKKLSQLHVLTEEYLDKKYAEKIIAQHYDINYQAPADRFFELRKPDLIGSTALHVVMGNRDIFECLLENGADFTLKNIKGLTVLHQAVAHIYDYYADDKWFQGRFESKLKNDYAELILNIHVESNSFINPCDKNGISHFHVACMMNNERAVEFFLRNGVPVDHAVNNDSPIFPGYTPLHIAAKCGCLETVDVLLEYGASTHIKDARGKTQLDVVVERNMEVVDWMHSKDSGAYYFLSLYSDIDIRENIINLIVNKKSDINNIGLPHFHAACTVKDTSMAENLLRKGCNIHQSVEVNSLWSGYTPLHFAAHFYFNMVKLLLENGANIEAEAACGVSPFDICVGRFKIKEIHFIIESHSIWKNIKLSDGKTKLTDLLYIMQKADCLNDFLRNKKLDINSFIPFNSPIWAGYTILHLAVMFTETFKITTEYSSGCDNSDENGINHNNDSFKRHRREVTCTYLERIQTCLNYGADVTIPDANGHTPLLQAFRLSRLNAVKLMLELHWKVKNPTDSDNLSHLYIACYAEEDSVVEKLLSNGADANGSILPSFKWYKNENSFIHRYRSVILKIAGSTPLHISVSRGSAEITSILLKHGADVNAKDCSGLTPIHKLLCTYHNADKISDLLFSSDHLKPHIFNDSLNYLHVAVYFGNITAVQRLLDMGVDVNATIISSNDMITNCNKNELEPFSFMNRYSGFTPLHINMRKSRSNHDITKVLILNGADIFIKSSDRWCSFFEMLKHRYTIGFNDFAMSIIENDFNLQKRMTEDSGLTMLHIACWKVDVALIEVCLRRGEDVNAQVNYESPIWPGWTPIHVLMVQSVDMYIASNGVQLILQLLMENDADFTLTNSEMATPLHLIEADNRTMKIFNGLHRTYANSPFTSMLLRQMKDVTYNHSNSDGISHFHIACIRNDVDMIKMFLEHGADVNQPVNYFSDKYPGCTPLHLVLITELSSDTTSQSAATYLLIEYCANIHAKDTYGNTPLHVAVKYGHACEALLETLVRAGADINANNIFGETPLEILLKSNRTNSGDIKFFLKHGCRINSFNPINNEGYISQIFSCEYFYKTSSSINSLLEDVLSYCDRFDVDDMGRTVIHNIVSIKRSWITNYVDIIQKLISRGYDVDHQDHLGRTALHNAVQFNNNEAIIGLLEASSDINISDASGKTPLVKCLELFVQCNQYTNRFHQKFLITVFATHARKLQISGLYVNERIDEILVNLLENAVDKSKIEIFRNEMSMAKDIRIGLSMTLYDFLSETGAVAAYPIMTYSERNAVDKFFRSENNSLTSKRFKEIISLLKLQYRKALQRQYLIVRGTNALNMLFIYPFPEVCSRIILRFLTNKQLENLINSMS